MQETLFIKPILDNWYGNITRTNDIFNGLTDEQLLHEVAPGKNRAIYLLGHLTAVHDRMLPLLNFGKQLHPELDTFITSPDKALNEMPSATDLRNSWKEVNETLASHFKSLSPDEWLQKHTSVSEEDFVKEPHRNRLSVLASRTNHLSYHLGQLVFLKK
jgi:hypothetical protein